MARRKQTVLGTTLTILISLILYVAQQQGWLKSATKVVESSQPGLYKVTEFYDGDTISVDMNGVSEKVRFIGVDTPETHDPRKAVQCFGKAASAFTKDLIGANRVRLELDPQNSNRDRYSRLLRYVYLPDGRLVNAEIIKQGYGFAYVIFPFSKMEEFKTYQKEAQAAGKGLWNDCTPTKNDEQYRSNDAS